MNLVVGGVSHWGGANAENDDDDDDDDVDDAGGVSSGCGGC
jgi:hypothetical protein